MNSCFDIHTYVGPIVKCRSHCKITDYRYIAGLETSHMIKVISNPPSVTEKLLTKSVKQYKRHVKQFCGQFCYKVEF